MIEWQEEDLPSGYELMAFGEDDDTYLHALAGSHVSEYLRDRGLFDAADRVVGRDDVAYISGFEVSERGRGTGSAMLEEALRRLGARGVAEVYVHAHASPGREQDLAGFYRRHGFRRVQDGAPVPLWVRSEKLKPNKPINRFEYAVKQFAQGKNAAILPDLGTATLMLLGRDRWVTAWKDVASAPAWQGASQEEVRERMLDWWRQMEVLPEHHEYDFLIPWIARELARMEKAVRRGHSHSRTRETGALVQRGPSIAQWALGSGVDVFKYHLEDAIPLAEQYLRTLREQGIDIPQGEVVYEFDDGYTIQALIEPEQLEVEGDAMGHCVGGYVGEVVRGEAVIFSLRDPKGRPHATIEWRPYGYVLGRDLQRSMKDWVEDLVGDGKSAGRFVQIRGKENAMPAEKYRPYIQEFINEWFYGDKIGLLMVAMPGQTISFKDEYVRGLDFRDDYAWDGVPLTQADFREATFDDCYIGGEIGNDNVEFDGSMFIGCTVGTVYDVSFVRCVFETCRVGDGGMEVLACDFEDASFVDCEVHGHFIECNMSDAVFSQCSVQGTFERCTLDRVHLKGFTSVDWAQFWGTHAQGMRMDDRVVVRRFEASKSNFYLMDVEEAAVLYAANGLGLQTDREAHNVWPIGTQKAAENMGFELETGRWLHEP